MQREPAQNAEEIQSERLERRSPSSRRTRWPHSRSRPGSPRSPRRSFRKCCSRSSRKRAAPVRRCCPCHRSGRPPCTRRQHRSRPRIPCSAPRIGSSPHRCTSRRARSAYPLSRTHHRDPFRRERPRTCRWAARSSTRRTPGTGPRTQRRNRPRRCNADRRSPHRHYSASLGCCPSDCSRFHSSLPPLRWPRHRSTYRPLSRRRRLTSRPESRRCRRPHCRSSRRLRFRSSRRAHRKSRCCRPLLRIPLRRKTRSPSRRCTPPPRTNRTKRRPNQDKPASPRTPGPALITEPGARQLAVGSGKF